jgi:hypothetical protein
MSSSVSSSSMSSHIDVPVIQKWVFLLLISFSDNKEMFIWKPFIRLI